VGGEAALMRWLNDNIQYPANAQIYGIQGKVICQFIVNRDGSLSNIEVIKSVDPLLDNAAINALKKMPKWLAGELREKPVRVKFTLPIVFSMH
jgi:protein TonB